MLDCLLWAPHRVEHYKIAGHHVKYEQNPMITTYIDTQAYIPALDLAFIKEYKRGTSRPRLTQSCRVSLYRTCSVVASGNGTCFDTSRCIFR